MDVDDLTGVERPRMRALSLVLAVVLPVAAFVGAAALFVRSYVLPPSIAIGVPMQLAADRAAPVAEPQTAAIDPLRETTGSVGRRVETPAVASDPVPAATRVASVWDAVPIPAAAPDAASLHTGMTPALSAPVSDAAVLANEMLADSLPLAGLIPLPPMRPRFQVASVRGPVPMPRPRPAP